MSEETVEAKKPFTVHPNDSRTHGFGFGSLLPTGVTISAVVSTVVTGGDGSLTATGKAVITSLSTDSLGNEIAADEGVSATLANGTAGTDYKVTVTATDSNGETITGVFPVLCRN